MPKFLIHQVFEAFVHVEQSLHLQEGVVSKGCVNERLERADLHVWHEALVDLEAVVGHFLQVGAFLLERASHLPPGFGLLH